MNHVRLSRRFALGAIVVLVLGLTPSVALGVAGHLVITGPTDTNVGDIQILLLAPARDRQ